MAVIGVDPLSSTWWRLKGTSENDIMSSNGTYPADETDRALVFYGYAGNDTITNAQDKSTIDGGKGNDSIINYASNVSINAGAGNDYISNTGSGSRVISMVNAVAILGGDGDDTVNNSGENVLINAGTGNDFISNNNSDVTIASGTGNDYIYNVGANVLFKYTSGNDYIEGFDESCTLQIDDGIFFNGASSNGWDIFLTIGEYVVTLAGAAGLESLNICQGYLGRDKVNVVVGKRIYNETSKKVITGTSENDTIINYGKKATINALSGDDYVENWADGVSINSGAGNDSIRNENNNAFLDGNT